MRACGVDYQVSPAEGVGRGGWQGVGEDGEDERLGVPEGVPVVSGSGEALGGDGPVLGARPGLHDVEQAEADGLLDLDVAVDLDVGALPEGVQVLALLIEQPLPA